MCHTEMTQQHEQMFHRHTHDDFKCISCFSAHTNICVYVQRKGKELSMRLPLIVFKLCERVSSMRYTTSRLNIPDFLNVCVNVYQTNYCVASITSVVPAIYTKHFSPISFCFVYVHHSAGSFKHVCYHTQHWKRQIKSKSTHQLSIVCELSRL